MGEAASSALQSGLGLVDWAVVLGVLAAASLVGLAAGRRGSLREYFLAGRALPWWAVSASIVATEISAVTLISVPAGVFRPGGDFAYVQYAIVGNLLARLLVAWLLVPRYFEREIYSPYDLIGARLGRGAQHVAAALFALGGTLAQGARLFATAVVLEVLLGDPLQDLAAASGLPALWWAVGLVGGVAVLWTWFGGMATVVWTDVVLFAVFVAAALAVLGVATGALDAGWSRVLQVGVDARKLDFFDFDAHPARAYTFWAALLAASWSGVSAYGVDQLLAQRLLCCRDVAAARKAILWSGLSVLVTVLVAFVGVALYAYYERAPMSGRALELWRANEDRLLPIFVLEVVPPGLRGLIVAGVVAAAVSTLTGILAALAQTAHAALRPGAQGGDGREVRASRGLVLLAGVVLCAVGAGMEVPFRRYGALLDLALAMAGYTQGALLAGVVLALSRARGGASGYAWSAPLSVLFVFATAWHGERSRWIVLVAAGVALALWVALRIAPALRDARALRAEVAPTLALVAALVALAFVQRYGELAVRVDPLAGGGSELQALAFPWYVPVGSTVAFVLGLWLTRAR